jgi:Helix-turn-helix family
MTRTAREMWRLFEPIHAVTYFAPQARAAFEEAGLRGFWRGYFAGRAAPLGPVAAAPVTASFFGFAPRMVERALPAVWELAAPERALEVRLAGATAALRRLLPDRETEVAAASEVLARAVTRLDCAGRVLAAADAALPMPDDPYARLWHTATVLREHRGDGHVAALVAAGLDGCESLAVRAGADIPRQTLQPVRGWTNEEWAAAVARLTDRGWLTPDGTITQTGQARLQAIEDATDAAAARPWTDPSSDPTSVEILAPVAAACAAEMPYPNPIGLPPRSTSAT